MSEKLSVIIPNYNHGHFLIELLPSLFAQSRQPDEVVIIDDGSTNNSIEIIEAFQKEEGRVRLFKNEVNKGVVFSLNFAVSQSKGDWVTFPSADNFVLPGMYEKSLRMLKQHPQAAVCCSDPVIFHEVSGIKERRKLNLSNIPKYFSPKETVEIFAKTGFTIGSVVHTIVVKKSALQEAGLNADYFIPKLRWHCDFFALNSVAFRYGFCYIPEELSMFRESPQSYSKKPVEWKIRKKVYQDLIRVINLSKNRDIKHAFKKSAILGEFTYSMLAVLISNPFFYEYFTFRLIHNCFWTLLRKACKIILPQAIYGLLRKILTRQRRIKNL